MISFWDRVFTKFRVGRNWIINEFTRLMLLMIENDKNKQKSTFGILEHCIDC